MDFADLLKKNGFKPQYGGRRNFPAVRKSVEDYLFANGPVYATDLVTQFWPMLGSSYLTAQNYFTEALWDSRVQRTSLGKAFRRVYKGEEVSLPKGVANRAVLYLAEKDLKKFFKGRTKIKKKVIFNPDA